MIKIEHYPNKSGSDKFVLKFPDMLTQWGLLLLENQVCRFLRIRLSRIAYSSQMNNTNKQLHRFQTLHSTSTFQPLNADFETPKL